MTELFSNKKINVGRQVEFDIAKGLSIIFMFFFNCLMVSCIFNNTISEPYQFIIGDILGKPFVAPILMFCMGIGIVYSRHKKPDMLIKRGIKLFLLGILVNIFNFLLPGYVAGILLNQWNLFSTLGGLILFFVDILAFAGLTLILMAILKKINFPDNTLLTIGILLSLLGSLFRFTNLGSDILNLVFGYFIGTDNGLTFFPLFNWFIFPVAGYVWGQYFIRCTDKSKFFNSWPLFLIVSILYFIFSTQIEGGFLVGTSNFYYMTTLDVIFCIMYIHSNIGLCYYLKNRLPDIVIRILSVLSENITVIYIIQCLIVPLLMILLVYIFNNIVFNDLILLILTIFVIVISVGCSILYNEKISGKHI